VRLHDPTPPSRLQPDLSTDLEAICLKCLQKEPQYRYASAEDLAIDLARFLGVRDLPAKTPPPEDIAVRLRREFQEIKSARTLGYTSLPNLLNYELVEEVGRGSISVVYKARMISANRMVALKLLKRQFQYGSNLLARVRETAKAVARLAHPSIVPPYVIGEHEGLPYFVLELLEGGGLDEKLMSQQPLPIAEAAGLVATSASTMHFVHQHGIVHELEAFQDCSHTGRDAKDHGLHWRPSGQRTRSQHVNTGGSLGDGHAALHGARAA